ncbi:MAG: hypothetical protein OHK0039_00330 [Bacteroidia bacterium]
MEPQRGPQWTLRQLALEDVHVYVLHEPVPDQTSRWLAVLDEADLRRYHRFRLPQKQQEFLIGRVLLRHVLAQYGGLDPAAIRFAYSPNGKPLLPGSPVQFNLSHAYGSYACIVARDRAVGIDVEWRQRETRPISLEHVFAPPERDRLDALGSEARKQLFFRLWTLKEAFWKALDPLSPLPFNRFFFTLDPIEVHSYGLNLPARSWRFVSQHLAPAHVLAAAIEAAPHAPLHITRFDVQPHMV